MANGEEAIVRKKIPTKGSTQKNILAQAIARKHSWLPKDPQTPPPPSLF